MELFNQNSAHLEAAQKEELEKPLLSARLPLRPALEAQFPEAGVFRAKVAHLAQHYGQVVFVRRDGNCFLRAFAAGLLLHLRRADEKEKERLTSLFKSTLTFCVANGYEEFIVEDFVEAFQEMMVAALKADSDDAVLEIMRGPESEYAVMLFRCVIGASMRHKSEFFHSFLPENIGSVEEYIKEEVDPMNHESEETGILALADYTGYALKIENLDLTLPKGASADDAVIPTNSHTFPLEPLNPTVACTLLFRPGHFDLLM